MERAKFTEDQQAAIRQSLTAALVAHAKKSRLYFSPDAYNVDFDPKNENPFGDFTEKFIIKPTAVAGIDRSLLPIIEAQILNFCLKAKKLQSADSGTAKVNVLLTTIGAQTIGDLTKFLNQINAELGAEVTIDTNAIESSRAK